MPRCGDVRIVTIDGPAGAGKTTLAHLLARELDDCPIVHMDDLYEGWTQDISRTLAERAQAWLLVPFRSGLPGHYLKYDWYAGRYAEWLEVPWSPIVIIEGVSAGHPAIAMRASFNIWIEANPELLLERVIARDGEYVRADMETWQTHESFFFENYSVREQADVRLRGE